MNEEIECLENKLFKLTGKLIQIRNLNKKLRLQIKEVLIVNNKLEKEVKQFKQQEANKLAGFLSIGAVYEPKIDRTYKFKE
jgi:DNA repair ATPase RecN